MSTERESEALGLFIFRDSFLKQQLINDEKNEKFINKDENKYFFKSYLKGKIFRKPCF